jgi:phosphatidylinositol alpha-mannosyltransferase
MRIAITSPTTWPYVRRGGERFINELARDLAQRGHDVTIHSGKPGRTETRSESGYTTVYHRRLWHPALARIGLLEFHAFFLRSLPALLVHRYDVVLCATFLDTFAATLARRFTGTPCLFLVNSPPPPVQYFRSLTLGGGIVRRAMRDADEVLAVSRYMQDLLAQKYGRPGVRLPVPVDLDRFPLSRTRDHERPIILCAAALGDERKGGRLLFQAFDRLKQTRPTARLQIGSPVEAAVERELLALVSPRWREDVEFLDDRDLDLPAAFGRAAISVLPSLWEAFGMVVVESMATGTPAVGTRDGALPELICDDGVGRLFDPGPSSGAAPTNVEGLVQAMDEALTLSRDPDTAVRCRARADEFSWTRQGPRYEELFERLRITARGSGSERSLPTGDRETSGP